MTARAFDTLEIMNDLKKSGVPEKQAKTHVEVLVEVTNELSTKQDIVQLEQRLINKIKFSMVKLHLYLAVFLGSFIFALFKYFLQAKGM